MAKEKIALMPPSGYALEFDGTDTYVEVADSPSLDIIEQITIEAWIYPHTVDIQTPDWRTIIAKLASYAEAYGFLTTQLQNEVCFYIQTGGVARLVSFGCLDIQKDAWNHIVGTFTMAPGDNMFLYHNGEIKVYGEVSHGTIGTSDLPLLIGGVNYHSPGKSSYAPYHFDGIIDEIRIYNRVLTAAEVQEHYNGIFNDETGLAALWHLNEGFGTETADGSGNANNGTLFNDPQWVEIGMPPPSDLCIWLADHGAPSNISIPDVFTIINAYLFETPPSGYVFTPTLQNVLGVIDYYFGFDGDAKTGCDFFP